MPNNFFNILNIKSLLENLRSVEAWRDAAVSRGEKTMGKYVDGFVLPVPKKNIAAYRRMSQAMGKLMKKYGALEYIEAVGDDLDSKMGGMKFTKFAKMANAKSGETVLFSYIVFKSRAHRDKVNKMVMEEMMKDPKYNKDMKMPFDMARMAYGGFKTIVDA